MREPGKKILGFSQSAKKKNGEKTLTPKRDNRMNKMKKVKWRTI